MATVLPIIVLLAAALAAALAAGTVLPLGPTRLSSPCKTSDFPEDFVSLMSVDTKLKRATPAGASAASIKLPALSELEGAGWEQRFSLGELVSKQFTDQMAENKHHSWMHDTAGGTVPVEMKEAEDLLIAAEDAPEDQWKEKTAVRSLRLYHHARWLAERSHSVAAEFRFHEAAALARRSRRSVLASHALGRLGYFLLQWRRPAEAKEVLAEAERLNGRTNPLATYLHAVLLRQDAREDVKALRAAEDRILNVGAQPSEELEAERVQHVQDIQFWRAAETNPQHCLSAHNVAHALICTFGHVAFFARRYLTGDQE